MSAEARNTAGTAGDEAQAPTPPTGDLPAGDAAGETPDESPTGLQTADSWAEAADRTGTVQARRQMPEPDSLGG